MRKSILLLTSVLLAGCATTGPQVYNPVKNVEYGAMGHDPFWMVTVGGDAIVLTLGPAGGRADGELTTVQYPRALPRESQGIRRWEAGEGTQVLGMEARPGPCRTPHDGRVYADHVRVTLSGRMLEGCGGREVRG